MSNHYKNFNKASESNWQLIVDLFQKSKFKIYNPIRVNSCNDGILVYKQNIIIAEVKRRQFTNDTLINEYNGEFFLEKAKYNCLHKIKTTYQAKYRGKNIKIWYITKTSDGYIYIYDITNKKYNWVTREMNSKTYTVNQKKVNKKVALLNVKEAYKTLKTNIKY
jgi:hypothetical protein